MASPAQLAARAKFIAMVRAKKGMHSGAAPMASVAPSTPTAQPVQSMPQSPMGQMPTSPFGQVVMNNPMNPNMKVPSHSTMPHANNPKINKHGSKK